MTQDTTRNKTFSPGDRVRVVQGYRWHDPRVERLVKAGRLATVRGVIGTARPPHERGYSVVFDVARKGAEPVLGFNIPVYALELEAADGR